MKKFSTKLFALLLTALIVSLIARFLIDGSLWREHSRPRMIERENLPPVLEQIENSGVDATKLYTVLRPQHAFWKTFLAQIIGLAIVLFIYGKNLKLMERITNKKNKSQPVK